MVARYGSKPLSALVTDLEACLTEFKYGMRQSLHEGAGYEKQ